MPEEMLQRRDNVLPGENRRDALEQRAELAALLRSASVSIARPAAAGLEEHQQLLAEEREREARLRPRHGRPSPRADRTASTV